MAGKRSRASTQASIPVNAYLASRELMSQINRFRICLGVEGQILTEIGRFRISQSAIRAQTSAAVKSRIAFPQVADNRVGRATAKIISENTKSANLSQNRRLNPKANTKSCNLCQTVPFNAMLEMVLDPR